MPTHLVWTFVWRAFLGLVVLFWLAVVAVAIIELWIF